eukprot:4827283-Amphidinium_carterae.1
MMQNRTTSDGSAKHQARRLSPISFEHPMFSQYQKLLRMPPAHAACNVAVSSSRFGEHTREPIPLSHLTPSRSHQKFEKSIYEQTVKLHAAPLLPDVDGRTVSRQAPTTARTATSPADLTTSAKKLSSWQNRCQTDAQPGMEHPRPQYHKRNNTPLNCTHC